MAALPPGCPPNPFSMVDYWFNDAGTCGRQQSFYGGTPPFGQGVGYAVVLGLGLFFSVFTAALVWLEERYIGTVESSEWFNTAGRNVKTGLIASVIVSQWTWAATILQSSNVAWKYGVSGPFWYASGATIQVLLFGVMAIEIKRKAPSAHTITEIVMARWGPMAHKVFLFFCFMTNIIVTSMLILGGGAVVNALTGMNVYAASFLIPLGVIFYTLSGGLKATFLASYVHSVIIHVALMIFIWTVYVGKKSEPGVGSARKVFDSLTFSASGDRTDCSLYPSDQHCGPVSGNSKGSYLTMLSRGGFIFGIINIVGNFGTVFVDQGYWQSAIAARPSSSHKGYLLGGLVWFAVPFALASSLGLAAIALDLPLTSSEAGSGLVPPASAQALLGKGGAALLLIMLFMAVTSAGSAELIAVSSLCTYDIYRTYFNRNATGKQVLFVSRIFIIGYGVLMGCLASLLNVAGISLGWMYEAMGTFIGSAVIPVALLLLWKDANAIGAMAGCIIGCVAGVISWLVVTAVDYDGRVNLDTTGRDAPMLTGNLVAILIGGAVHIVASLIWPQNYDWESMKTDISMVENEVPDLPEGEYAEEHLLKARKFIISWGVGFTVVMVILWPLLSLPVGVFNIGYWTFWVIIVLAWGTIGSVVIIVLPVYESWAGLTVIFEGLFTADVTYRKLDDLSAKLDAIVESNPEILEKYQAKKAALPGESLLHIEMAEVKVPADEK